MYKRFYGLSEKPFHIAPNPEYLYFSSKHQNALTYMEYGIREGAGFVLLTGEVGTGKTTLIRYLLNQIEAEMKVAVIFNTNVNSDQLLELILREFELDSVAGDKPKNLETLYQHLIQKYAQNEKVLLIIDEAQNLSDDALEEVRMLSNLQTDNDLLLQIMFVGQPELKAKLQRPSFSQLAQRIIVNYHLMPLTHEETRMYIASRLEKADGSPEIFTADAVNKIFLATKGIPRLVNLLCDSALVYGYSAEIEQINESVISHVIEDKGDIGLIGGVVDPVGVEGVSALRSGSELTVEDDRKRLDALEADMLQLKMQVQWQIEELEKRAGDFKDDLVRQLQSALADEKKRLKEVMISVGRLQQKYRDLKKRHDANDDITLNKDEVEPQAPRKNFLWFSRNSG